MPVSSPAEVIAKYLVDVGIGQMQVEGDLSVPNPAFWWIYTHHLPTMPDQAIAVKDGTGISHGRPLPGRQRANIRPEVNFIIRSKLPRSTGWTKGQEILNALSLLSMTSVIVPGDTTNWVVQCYTAPQSELVFLEEEEKSKRQVFVINGGLLTIHTQ